MTEVFADTWYFLALLNSKDQGWKRVVEWSDSFAGNIVTTTLVLIELADGLAASAEGRVKFGQFYADLKADPDIEIVKLRDELFENAIDLYSRYGDKKWSLTDCLSFLVMREKGLNVALTADHDFEQAGFVAFFKQNPS